MHLLYTMTKSAIAIGHLALPFPPLHRKRKSEKREIRKRFMRTSIRSTPYTMAACSLSPLPLHLSLQHSKVPSGPHFQINPIDSYSYSIKYIKADRLSAYVEMLVVNESKVEFGYMDASYPFKGRP